MGDHHQNHYQMGNLFYSLYNAYLLHLTLLIAIYRMNLLKYSQLLLSFLQLIFLFCDYLTHINSTNLLDLIQSIYNKQIATYNFIHIIDDVMVWKFS
jgi:hypothetical protein